MINTIMGFFRRLFAAVVDLTVAAVVVLLVGCVYFAYDASRKDLPASAAQHAYAERFCVSEQHGALAKVFVNNPDLFHTNGSAPHLTVRCSFGGNAYMLKTVDIAGSGSVPSD